jgi:secreted trypsin-like serine protease
MLVFLDLGQDDVVEDVVAVRLNSKASVPASSQDATVVGWGNIDASKYYQAISNVLMEVSLNVVPNNKCSLAGWFSLFYKSYDSLITENMLCAKAAEGGSCKGNSGRPLVIRGGGGDLDVQVGAVLLGIGCTPDKFLGIYVRVSRAYDWILSKVCLNSNYASKAGFDCPPTTPAADWPANPPISAPTQELRTSNDPFTICPNSATNSASVPYANKARNVLTCKDIIDAVMAYETGSDDCTSFESLELEQYYCPADTATDDNVLDKLWGLSVIGHGIMAGNIAR